MTTSKHWHPGDILGLAFALLIFCLSTSGCDEDDTTTSISSSSTAPSVAGNWVGSGQVDMSGYRQGIWIFDVDGSIVQTADSFGGIWTYTGRGTTPRQQVARFVGKISTSRDIALRETSQVVVTSGGGAWFLSSFACKLSSNGDTISGGGLTPFQGSSAAREQYTFIMVKK